MQRGVIRLQLADENRDLANQYPLPTGRVAILIHGSSGSSGNAIHVLSTALAAHGVESYAVDIRGHGSSGTRGDIRYVGQEFIPTRNPLEGLRQAVRLCDV